MRPLALFLIGLILGGGIGVVGGMGLTAPAHVHDDSHLHTVAELAAEGAMDHSATEMGGTHTAHVTLSDVSGDGPAPTVALELQPVAGGYSLHIVTENYTFAPGSVDGIPVPGQGHAHVYADGVKILRALGPWVDLPGLAPGTDLRVDLTANDHATLALGTAPISATLTVPDA